MGILNTLKADSKEAAYRVAGVQIIKATKQSLLAVLRGRNIDNKHVESLSNFLDTDMGTAALSGVVGFMLVNFPAFKKDKRAQTIAKEFRVGGMALAGNLLADKAIQELLPTMSGILDNLPTIKLFEKAPKIRVANIQEPVHEELEEEEQTNHTNHTKRNAVR